MLRRILESVTRDWALKLLALGLAFLLWTVVRADAPERIPIRNVPIRVDNEDPAWVLAAPPDPAFVTVTFTGPLRDLIRIAAERPEVVVPVDDVGDSIEVVLLRPSWVRSAGGFEGTRVGDVRPESVRLTFQRIDTDLVPIAIRVTGALPPGFELDGSPFVDPPAVRASGAEGRLAETDSLRLPPIDLGGRVGTDTVLVGIDTTGLGLLVSPLRVRVVVPIRRIQPDTAAADTAGARPTVPDTTGASPPR